MSQHQMEARRQAREKKEAEGEKRDAERVIEEAAEKEREEGEKLPTVAPTPLDEKLTLDTSTMAFDLLD